MKSLFFAKIDKAEQRTASSSELQSNSVYCGVSLALLLE